MIHYLLGGNHASTTNRTFARPLCEQELVLSPVSPSDHHTGQTSLRSRRLLRWFSGEVLNTQFIIPGLWGTERARPAVHWGRCEEILLNIYNCRRVCFHDDNGKPVLTSLTAVLYIRQGWGLSVQLPHQLNGILLPFEMNLHIHTHCINKPPVTGSIHTL